MFFYLKVSSKDSQVLKKFCQFLLKLENSPTLVKHFSQKNKQRFITILKSPHGNKTAQEQFEFRYYSRKFLINSFKPLKFFLLLKKIKNVSFPGVKLEVEGLVNERKKTTTFLNVLNPDNIVLPKNCYGTSMSQSLQKKYIQLFDCYGEWYLKNSVHLSQSSD